MRDHQRVKIQVVAVLTAAALLLTGCTGKSQEGSPEESESYNGTFAETAISYSETNITPVGAEDLTSPSLSKLPHGRLLLVGKSGEEWRSWESEDGREWSEVSMDWLAAVQSNYGYIETMAMTRCEDGGWWMVFAEKQEDRRVGHLIRVDGQGASEEIAVPFFQKCAERQDDLRFTNALYQTPQGLAMRLSIYPSAMGMYGNTPPASLLHIFPEAPEQEALLIQPDNKVVFSSVNDSGDTLYGVAVGESWDVLTWDLSTGEETAFATLGATLDIPSFLTGCIEPAGSYCYLDGDGIHRMVQNGTVVLDLVKSSGMSFGSPRVRRAAMCSPDDSVFIVAYSYDDKFKLCLYDQSETGPPTADSGESSLSVWSLQASETLREAVVQFAVENPGIDISYERAYEPFEETGATLDDTIRALNTRILVGDCPDVLILDGLPAQAYIQKGALEDLTGLLPDMSGHYENILSAYEVDGKTYAYPATFIAPLIVFSDWFTEEERASLTTLTALADLATSGPGLDKVNIDVYGDALLPSERPHLFYSNAEILFDELYPSASASIFAEGNAVDEQALREFFTASKRMAEFRGLGNGYLGGASKTFFSGTPYHSYPESFFYFQCLQMSMGAMNFRSAYLIGDIKAMPYSGGFSWMAPMPGNVYVPSLCAAVPIHAENKANAEAFIRLLLTDDAVQSNYPAYLEGLPVKRSAYARLNQSMLNEYKALIEDDEEPEKTPEQFLAELESIPWDEVLEQLTVPSVTDRELREKVYTVAMMLYDDTLTVDEAVDLAVEQTRLHLLEND